ncbi:hypothetical protein F4802DRAFT_299736 [Xylaria palmicola]|nr:hypothetical protein F4802DRAFT_299736 [Xylaria palmicola]
MPSSHPAAQRNNRVRNGMHRLWQQPPQLESNGGRGDKVPPSLALAWINRLFGGRYRMAWCCSTREAENGGRVPVIKTQHAQLIHAKAEILASLVASRGLPALFKDASLSSSQGFTRKDLNEAGAGAHQATLPAMAHTGFFFCWVSGKRFRAMSATLHTTSCHQTGKLREQKHTMRLGTFPGTTNYLLTYLYLSVIPSASGFCLDCSK